MPRKNPLARKRLDKYYRLAKDEGFKSRAAFKLLQINREFDILGSCQCLLDLCAAPGGWTQVALKSMPLSSLVVAVDLVKMKGIGGCKTIQGDIFTQKCKFDIKKALGNIKPDVVLHDGSPDITGTWSKDSYAQCELTLQSLKLAAEFLKFGGIFVTKIFRSNDYNSILWVIKQLFNNVVSYKPMASRTSSAEIYLVCKGYLAPKKIDPRLFQAKFVFKEIEDKKDSISVMKMRKKKKHIRNRSGYDNDITGVISKSVNVIKFIESDKPETILGEYNLFTFDEIKILLSDLTLLNKSDFRKLLKWRKKMIKYINDIKGITTIDDDNKETKNDANEDKNDNESETERLKKEVQKMYDDKRKEQKKKKRKIRQAKIKRARTMYMGGIMPDDVWDFSDEQIGLFKLDDFENSTELNEYLKTQTVVKNENPFLKKEPITHFWEEHKDSDSELEMQSQRLDDLYQRYKHKRNIVTREDKKIAKKQLAIDVDLGSDDEFKNSDLDQEMEMNDSDSDNEDEKKNDLIVDTDTYVDNPEPKSVIAKRWFGDNIFDDIERNTGNNDLMNEMKEFIKDDDDTKMDNDDDTPFEEVKQDTKKNGNGNVTVGEEKKAEIELFKAKDLPDVLKLPYKLQRKIKKMNRDHRRRLAREEEKRIERDCLFQEVPLQKIDKNDDNYMSTDSEGVAETLAIGEKMLKKKTRNEIIDNSYNKWTFMDDPNELPKWFVDDENGNYKVNLPVTKEEVRAYKEKLRAANARPIKKVAEAKARKKMRAMKQWNKIKRQATKIADNQDLSEKSKIKQIQKLYKKMNRKEKVNKVYMICSGSKGMNGLKRVKSKTKMPKNALKVRVDRRLKADKLGKTHVLKRLQKGKIKRKRTMNRKNVRKKSRRS